MLSLSLVPISTAAFTQPLCISNRIQAMFWIWISPANTRTNAPPCLLFKDLWTQAPALLCNITPSVHLLIFVHLHMFLISHSDSSLLSTSHTQVTGWVKKAVVSADVDIKLLAGDMLKQSERGQSWYNTAFQPLTAVAHLKGKVLLLRFALLSGCCPRVILFHFYVSHFCPSSPHISTLHYTSNCWWQQSNSYQPQTSPFCFQLNVCSDTSPRI